MVVEKRANSFEGRSGRLMERVVQVCAAVAMACGLLALMGWAMGRLILARWHADFIPMAPTTALAFLLLGGALLIYGRQPTCPWIRVSAGAATVLVLLLGLLVLGQYLTGADLGLEGRMSQGPATFGRVPIGRMSPLAAGTFLVTSTALLALAALPPAWRNAREAAANAAAGVVVVGVLVALGYWRGAAFLTGGGLIPMAFPAAVAFIFLGAGLLAAAGPRVWMLRDYRPLLVGLGAGLAVSIILFVIVTRLEQRRIQAEFERKADVVALAFRQGLRENIEELENVRALFALSGSVDRRSFQTFASQILARRPSIRAFSWNPRVTDRERAGTEALARRDGFPAYQFIERYPDGRLGPAGRRAEYAPVLYVEPLAGNEAALGFDPASDTARQMALEKARDTGRIAATEPVTPVPETRREAGMLIVQPVYRPGQALNTLTQRRANLLGFVIEVLRLEPLIRSALPDPEREGVEFRLVDATATLHQDLVFASPGAETAADSRISFSRWISVADRQWRLELYAAPWYLAARQGNQAWGILGSGLLLTIVLGTYVLSSARHTAEVTQLSEGLRKISRAVEQSPAAVVITDTQGSIEYVNPKFTRVTGYTFEEARGQNPRVLKSGETPPEEYQRLWATITAGKEWQGEFHNKKKSGELFWEAASISPVRDADGRITHFVAVKEDITERKQAERALAQRTRQLEALRVTSEEITRELDLARLLDLIMRRATELLGTDMGSLYLWDEATQVLIPQAWRGHGAWEKDLRLRPGEGVAGAVVQLRRGLIVNDFRRSSFATPHLLAHTTHGAVLAEPLLYRGLLLGVVTIDGVGEGDRIFRDEDQHVLRLFASQAAIAIGNARLFDAGRRELDERKLAEEALTARTRQLQVLNEVTQTLTTALEREAAATAILAALQVLLPGVAGQLWEYVPDGEALELINCVGMTTREAVDRKRLRVGEGLAGLAAATRKELYSPDVSTDTRFVNRAWAHAEGLVSGLALPLVYGTDLQGSLVLLTRAPRRFDEDEMGILHSFAAQAAISFANAQLYRTVREHATVLESRVVERTAELELLNVELADALHQAEAGDRAKSEFLVNMSHELRTPLNSVLGFTQLLKERLGSQGDPKHVRYLANIFASGQRLLGIINDMLDLGEVEQGRLALDCARVDPTGVIREAMAVVHGVAQAKGLALQTTIPEILPAVPADPLRLKQVLLNLLSNAVKFTPSGGAITVTARRAAPLADPITTATAPRSPIVGRPSTIPGDGLELSVIDTGIGIKPEDLPRLFQKFTQLESAHTKQYGGTGAGLALSKQIVELHGGRLWAESAGEGKGSTFTVWLPLDGPAAPTAAGLAHRQDGNGPSEASKGEA